MACAFCLPTCCFRRLPQSCSTRLDIALCEAQCSGITQIVCTEGRKRFLCSHLFSGVCAPPPVRAVSRELLCCLPWSLDVIMDVHTDDQAKTGVKGSQYLRVAVFVRDRFQIQILPDMASAQRPTPKPKARQVNHISCSNEARAEDTLDI